MITNPQPKRILCFGDSLTWGYMPGTGHQRYPANVRWTGVLQEKLGTGYEVIEEGLNSRGIANGDPRPGKEGRDAMDYIVPCLDTHDPLDFVVVMLGTNELKHSFTQTPAEVAQSMRELLGIIISRPSQFRTETPNVILMSPPTINDQTEYCRTDDKYTGATAKAIELNHEYQKLATELGIGFISLASIAPGVDGIHMDAVSHAIVGNLVAEKILREMAEANQGGNT